MKSFKFISAAIACLGLFAAASASAQTVWKPPAEISQKAGEAAQAAPDAAAAAPQTRAEKEKSCKEQAVAKGLKGKAKKQAIADCLKG